MVDDFQAKYGALSIAYPGDQGTLAAIDAQSVEAKASAAAFCAESSGRIGEIKMELAKWEAMAPGTLDDKYSLVRADNNKYERPLITAE